jgi:hypothetical protein
MLHCKKMLALVANRRHLIVIEFEGFGLSPQGHSAVA